MPRRRHTGIIGVDPSFCGCAVVVMVPSLSYVGTSKFDLRGDPPTRSYDSLPNVAAYGSDMWLQIVERHGDALWECDTFVIESQFTTAMKRLRDVLTGQVAMTFRMKGHAPPEIVVVPAYTWRGHFGLSGDSYRKRKQESVTYFSANPQLLCWSSDIKDDDRCEAILLLNYLVEKRQITFTSNKPYSDMSGITPPNCTHCSTPGTPKISGPDSKRPGNVYYACENKASCPKPGFICYQGDTPKVFGKRSATTNPNAAIVPLAKQAPKPAQMPQLSSHATEQTMLQILKAIQKVEKTVSMYNDNMTTIFNGLRNMMGAAGDDEEPPASQWLVCDERPLSEQWDPAGN